MKHKLFIFFLHFLDLAGILFFLAWLWDKVGPKSHPFRFDTSLREHSHTLIYTPSRDHAADPFNPQSHVLLDPVRARRSLGSVPIDDDRDALGSETRGPAQTRHEMPVRVLDRLDALALLAQVPAADRLVVAGADQVPAAWMEDQRADPVVVARQCLDAGAAAVPELDQLVSTACRAELGGGGGWRGFL